MSVTTDEAFLYARLLALATTAGNRVTPGTKLREGVTLPAMHYFRVSAPRDRTQSSGDVPYPRFQISCWGKNYDEANVLGNQVRVGLGGYRGTVGDRTATVLIDDERGPLEDAETGEYSKFVDVVLIGGR